ncbi:MAG: methyltransferase [Acidimicrobiia bacterium]
MTTHRCDFGPLRVRYDDTMLEPRPWTLVQSRRAAALLEVLPPGPVLELHCGAGHIGQAAALWSKRHLVQVDDHEVACRWARDNASVNDIDATVVCSRVETLCVEDASFALVIADPPYVPSKEVERFAADPVHAIDGGDDGLEGLRACLPVAARALQPGGALVVQVRGAAQAARVAGFSINSHLEISNTMELGPDRAIVTLLRR